MGGFQNNFMSELM